MTALYRAGIFKLGELITTRSTIDEINRGCQDLRDGKNICDVVIHDH
jgi:alcohol dehydrogenase (nicotinoprotein)